MPTPTAYHLEENRTQPLDSQFLLAGVIYILAIVDFLWHGVMGL